MKTLPERNMNGIMWICSVMISASLIAGPISGYEQITDATGLSSGYIEQTITPQSIDELQGRISTISGPIAVAGARYSQGGQTWANGGTIIDMRNINRILDIDITHKHITVEAGATWREVQNALNPLGLSPRIMQSYNDFSIGGSLSVNVHGRNIAGSIITSVKSIDVLLSDGSLVTASRSERPDLLYAIIGGYGACGIITKATLEVVDNVAIRRSTHSMHISEYISYLRNHIINNPNVILHNANLYPNAFEHVCAINWVKDTDNSVVRSTRLMGDRSFEILPSIGELCVRRVYGLKYAREQIEPVMNKKQHTTHRNYEIGQPIATLGPCQIISSNILQEYFIPLDNVEHFITRLRHIQRAYRINIINASLRYVPADHESVLSYAPCDCCSIVLYINLIHTPGVWNNAQTWTQALIDAAIACNGAYYLPYHLFARHDQFRQAYPYWHVLKDRKQQYDPCNKLSNQMLDTYMLS